MEGQTRLLTEVEVRNVIGPSNEQVLEIAGNANRLFAQRCAKSLRNLGVRAKCECKNAPSVSAALDEHELWCPRHVFERAARVLELRVMEEEKEVA
jgi:hypothetical protein